MKAEVELRDIEVSDLPLLFEHQREPDANEMAEFPARDRDGFMEHWGKVLADRTILKKAVLFQGEVAGNIVSFEQGGERQIGYWIGQQFWGRGIATSALAMFLELVGERPLYAHVAKHNAGSIRVLEKCGFTLYGQQTVADVPDGSEMDEFIFKLEELGSAAT